ncbi:MAG TPA: ABC transporter ATP-binding protein [Kineosporiaceae bacterium]|nr:ABC transporter ATP-binding protein [Kineosporiaceae bacterium]
MSMMRGAGNGSGHGPRPEGPGGGQPGAAPAPPGGAGEGAVRRPPGRGGPFGGGPHGFGMPVEKPKEFKATFRRLAGRLRPQSAVISLVMVLGTISVTLSIIGPKLLGNATQLVFEGVISKNLPKGVTTAQVAEQLRRTGHPQQAEMIGNMHLVPGAGIDFGALRSALLVVVLVYVLSALFGWAQGYLMAGVAQRVVYQLREDADRKLGRLPLRYFDSHPRGEVLSRITNDIDNINTAIQQSLTQIVSNSLMIIGVLAMMVWISPLLAVISLLTVPLSFVVTMLIAKRSQKQFKAQWMWTGKLNGHVEEMYSGHDLVKVFGHRQQAIEDFDRANEQMYQASFRAQFVSGIIQPAMAFISNLNYVGVAVLGGLRVASGTMSLGDVQAFIQYSRQFTMPITQLSSMVNLLQSAIASAERVFELLDAQEEEPDAAQPVHLPELSGRVGLEQVCFRYRPDTPLIEDLTLDVRPGETVAIVGPTGAGKTTVVNLLMRFYEVDSGRITLDGVDIRDLTRDELRRTFGMVLQDAWLFGGTIRDNIAYGAQAPTEEQIHEAARAAHVDHFVHTLPEGYDTVLDDEASNLSAGQKQLVTIARAFLADPAILILDEATSSVDTRTEVLIQKAMARLRQGRTSFVIAHRLSTIRDADVILVMDQGRIIEQGTHEELLAAHGFYHDLYQSQFAQAPTLDGVA